MLDKLYTFKIVYELKSFSLAASKLYKTQSAISKIIKSLEIETDTVLFERNGTHGLKPTIKGDILYERTNLILVNWDNTIELLNESANYKFECNIGFSQTVGEFYFNEIASLLFSKFPNVNFNIEIANSETIKEGVISKKLSFGYVEKPIESKTLIKEEVFHDQLVLVSNASSNLFLNRENDSGVRYYNDLYLLNSTKSYNVMHINSSTLIAELVNKGIGNTILSIKCISNNQNYSVLNSMYSRKIFVLHFDLLPKHQEILDYLNYLFKKISKI
ncbi:LysR family transcriptional regulator [Mycoplasma sp. P36-A1]|uniref:LysR family transcriptional regulator n=1 Tax=Mycoplasma sp. P36-A1 TaxID=3252900 RepID=UPI003C2ABA17